MEDIAYSSVVLDYYLLFVACNTCNSMITKFGGKEVDGSKVYKYVKRRISRFTFIL